MGLVFVPAATRHFAGRLKHRRTLRCITCTPVHYRRSGFISTIPELDRTPTPDSADCPAATPKAIYKVSHPMRPLCLRSPSGDKKTGSLCGHCCTPKAPARYRDSARNATQRPSPSMPRSRRHTRARSADPNTSSCLSITPQGGGCFDPRKAHPYAHGRLSFVVIKRIICHLLS